MELTVEQKWKQSHRRSTAPVRHWQDGHGRKLPERSGKWVSGGRASKCSRLCPWRCDRFWKMTQADRRASNFPPWCPAAFNFFAGLFPCAGLTSDTGEHRLRKLQTHDRVLLGYTIQYQHVEVDLRVEWSTSERQDKWSDSWWLPFLTQFGSWVHVMCLSNKISEARKWWMSLAPALSQQRSMCLTCREYWLSVGWSRKVVRGPSPTKP